MRARILTIPAAALLALSLGGCGTTSAAKKMTPEQAAGIITRLIERCGGAFEAEAGVDTGQLGGTARVSAKARAECPVPPQGVPPPAPAT